MTIINNQSISIRQATIDDIQHITAIKFDTHRIDEDSHPLDRMMNELFVREYKKRWHKQLNEGMCTLIISANGNMAGFISYSVSDDVISGSGNIAEINNIYVVPEMRGCRLGKLLCTTALERLKSEYYKLAVAWVVEGSDHIMRFYEGLGFQASSAVREDKIRENVVLKEIQYQIVLESI